MSWLHRKAICRGSEFLLFSSFFVLNMKGWFWGGGQHSWVICHRHTRPKIGPGRFFFFLLWSFRVSIKRNGMTYSSEDKHASLRNICFSSNVSAIMQQDQTEGPCRLHPSQLKTNVSITHLSLHSATMHVGVSSAQACRVAKGFSRVSRQHSHPPLAAYHWLFQWGQEFPEASDSSSLQL